MFTDSFITNAPLNQGTSRGKESTLKRSQNHYEGGQKTKKVINVQHSWRKANSKSSWSAVLMSECSGAASQIQEDSS